MVSDDTIAAVSSATGPAARIIVRLSGPDAHRIAREISDLVPAARGVANQSTLRFANLSVPAWLYVFTAPHSYTAQNLVEFHIPGNPLLARMLLTDLISRGARHAEPGEFTARAYFAGRIDLAEAEGVAATISAHSEQELRAARQLLAGELSRRLRPSMELLEETLALLEVGIDFSEEDVTFLSPAQVHERIDRIDAALRELVENSARFERLAHEPAFVLLGRPNAGKSTLLNALAGRERAVVSKIAGTTRDVLSAEVRLRRGIVRVLDVAGLGDQTDAAINTQMAQRARDAAESADYVMLVRDGTDERAVLDLPRPADLMVVTKSDLSAQPSSGDGLHVSAVTGARLDELRERLDTIAFGRDAGSSTLALNARHLQALADARQGLDRARTSSHAGAEVIALDLREALDALGQVLGQVSPDDLLGRIFSTFCIGK